MNIKDEITEFFPEELRRLLLAVDDDKFHEIEEIRLRARKPLIAKTKNGELFLSETGNLHDTIENAYISSVDEIGRTLEIISGYSLYAFDEEIKNGFITIKGGHRVGICGKYVVTDNEIITIKHVSSLNIRICHEIKGCANHIISNINANGQTKNTIIVSAPSLGKTTLLRDIVRQISDGTKFANGQNVALVDEREEISGSYNGTAQNDVGVRTDILLSCPKAKAMMLALRSLAPNVIAVDEIGSNEDIEAINVAINSGVKIICTVHGDSVEDLKRKPKLYEMIKNKTFECVILLTQGFKNGNSALIFKNRGDLHDI